MKTILIALALTALTAPAWAHHSFAAEYDAKKELRLTGIITKIDWINPHAWIHMNVKSPDGTATEWMIQTGTPNTLFRRGFSRDSVKVGTTIIVDGYAAKDGTPNINGRDVTFPDGRKLFLGSSGPGVPYDDDKAGK
jgi:hypothetical protein